MQAVILAGGLGTRLRPVTATVPKPMVPVAGVPYLEHQLRLLAEQRIHDVLLLTGYLGEQIEEYFGDGSRFGLKIDYSHEPHPLGTGGALRHALAKLQESFLVIYGDSYLPIQYGEAFTTLISSGAAGLVVAYDNSREDTSVKNNIDVDDQCFVIRYQKDAPDKLSYVEAGVLALRRGVVDLVAPDRPVSLEQEIFPKLIASRSLVAFITTQRFYDIGTPERLEMIERLLGE